MERPSQCIVGRSMAIGIEPNEQATSCRCCSRQGGELVFRGKRWSRLGMVAASGREQIGLVPMPGPDSVLGRFFGRLLPARFPAPSRLSSAGTTMEATVETAKRITPPSCSHTREFDATSIPLKIMRRVAKQAPRACEEIGRRVRAGRPSSTQRLSKFRCGLATASTVSSKMKLRRSGKMEMRRSS
eukprot:163161-Pleurochrysis_carterae.AAC.1